jgi:eukaryotic-like serine/threonine-protein kinase
VMALASGVRLGPYEIIAPLGAGGMGEVYRARDVRLNRTVAVKVLPAALCAEPDLRLRFEREARALSSLNHPNICTLHDLGNQGGVDFIVMEYLEGETLADRLRKGALPLEQALKIGIEVADALDKAHRRGIIHRDLKPGNIMLTKAGAKLMDFGLAKPAQQAMAVGSDPATRTVSKPLTVEGAILGTLQYMAPEQLQGAEADSRSDIFALGTVLYEMLTGTKAFTGKNPASLVAAILTFDPPSEKLKQTSPPLLQHLLKRALIKDPDERWQAASDFASNLRWVQESAGQEPATVSSLSRTGWRELIAWSLAAVALTVALIAFRTRTSAPAQTVRFQVPAPPGINLPFTSVSPDGRQLAITDNDGGQIWIRDLNSLTVRALPDLEAVGPVFWSPDSRYIAFFAGGKLRKVSVAGGSPETICEVLAGYIAAGSWSSQGTILFSVGESPGREGIYTVAAEGGNPTRLSLHDESGAALLGYWPQFLPDSQHFIFIGGHVNGQSNAGSGGNLEQVEQRSIYAADLATGKSVQLLRSDIRAEYAAPGYLLFIKEGTLLAQPIDLTRLKLTGEAVAVAEHVRYHQPLGDAVFSSSQSGTLAYSTGGPLVRLVSYDRGGQEREPAGDPGEYEPYFRLSPDGKRVVAAAADPVSGSLTDDIWIIDSARKTRLRFTSDAGDKFSPIWSPDGRTIVFSGAWKTVPNLYLQKLEGGPAQILLTATGKVQQATDWSRDGRWILFVQREPGRTFDIWALPFFGDRNPIRITNTPSFNEMDARISPDARWLVYQSDESGQPEIYVQAFGRSGEKILISSGGGSQPRWRGDGKELFYLAHDGIVMGVGVQSGPNFTFGNPRPLFLPKSKVLGFDVSPDGQRFLISSSAGPPPQTTVLLNWSSSLR